MVILGLARVPAMKMRRVRIDALDMRCWMGCKERDRRMRRGERSKRKSAQICSRLKKVGDDDDDVAVLSTDFQRHTSGSPFAPTTRRLHNTTVGAVVNANQLKQVVNRQGISEMSAAVLACPAWSCLNNNTNIIRRQRRHAVVRRCCSAHDEGTGRRAPLNTQLSSSWRRASAQHHRRRSRRGDTTTTNATSATNGADDVPATAANGSTMLVEVSAGGQQQRRWARSPTGGFERLPPTRQSKTDVANGAAAKAEDDGWSWDLRQSPRRGAVQVECRLPNP